MTSCDESRIFQEKNTVAPVDPERVATRDIIDYESNFEPEAKRLKSVTTGDHCSPLEEKPSWPRKTRALAQTATSPLTGKGWQCGFCTYINNSVLPYCEMCENPQGSAGEYPEGDHGGGWQCCLQLPCASRDDWYSQRLAWLSADFHF